MNFRMVGLILTLLLVSATPAAAGEVAAGEASVQNCVSGCVTKQPIRGKPWTDDITTSPFSGYTGKLSYFPGEDIDFHVAAANPDQLYKLFVFREGNARPLVHAQLSNLPATVSPAIVDAEFGFTWETSALIPGLVTASWPSGYYLARLEPESVNSAQFDNTGEYIPFILKPVVPSSGKILVQLPTNTWLAYNDRLGRSYYTSPRTFEASFHRPQRHYWAWINGATPSTVADVEGYYLRWLDQNGFSYDVVGNSDIEDNAILTASNYRLLITLGHDEYWTHGMKGTVKDFVDDGGNLLLFASGAIYYQARFEDSGDTLTCYKITDYASEHDPLWNVNNSLVTTRFTFPPVDQPEAALIGLSYNYGGNNNGISAIGGYRVYQTDDWVFANTGLHNGDLIGLFSNVLDDILAQETDATYYTWSANLPVPYSTATTHTPANFKIVGIHVADSLPLAMMGYYTNDEGAMVFNVGTWDWWKGLFLNDPTIVQITHNVLARLTQGSIRPAIARPLVYQHIFKQGVNGYTGAADTTLNADSPASNFGSSPTLELWHDRLGNKRGALVKFDADSLPAVAEILSAQMVLYPLSLQDGGELKVGAMQPSAQWDEALASWNSPDGQSPWPGASATIGPNLDNEFIRVTQRPIGFEVTPQVQTWLTDPAANWGLALRGVTRYDQNWAYTTMTFASSDHPDVALHPELVVYYHCALTGDVDSNGIVDTQDIQSIAEHWNSFACVPGSGYDERYDLDHDQDIDTVDIQLAASQWGQSCFISN
jgi:hypothetical protein